MTGDVAGVILAAGEGSRLGVPKALAVVAGQRLVDLAVRMLREGGASPVVAVTGAADVDVEGVIAIHNPNWRTGMGSSLAVGLGAVPERCGAAVVALVDQPLIGAETVRRLIAAHRAGADLAVACYQGRPRNPVLLARRRWPGVLAMATGDVGARPYLRAHLGEVADVECGDIGSPDDVDTAEDLIRVGRLLSGRRLSASCWSPATGTAMRQ